jgi:hypothetical protein
MPQLITAGMTLQKVNRPLLRMYLPMHALILAQKPIKA